jgi:hypothetical protein
MLKNFKVIVFCTFVAFGGFLVSDPPMTEAARGARRHHRR